MSSRSLTPEPTRAQPVRTPARGSESSLSRSGVTEMEWEPEQATQSPELHLAGLEVHGNRTLIFDDDSARALVTHWLLRELAPMLGLDPSKIEVHVDSDAASRNDARQTTGLVESGAIYIHPRGFDPSTKAGRSLLAHEAAHVAQRLLSAPGAQHTERAHAAAEHEAAAIAHAFAERATVMQPRSSLPALVTAAAEDAAAAPPLSATVSVSRAREIAEIHRILSGLWISDGDVFEVMRILDTMAFAVAKQVVTLLGNDSEDRYHLADNINAPHLGPHTASVIATYAALPQAELRKAIDLDVFGEGVWGEMTSEVRQAAREVIALLTSSQRDDLARSDNRLDIKSLTSGAAVLPDNPKEQRASEEKVRLKEAKLAEGRKEIAALEGNNDATALLQSVRDALKPPVDDEGNPSAPQRALAAMQLLAPYRDTAMLSFVAEKLDAEGLVDTIVETLPDNFFFESKPQTEIVLQLVQARLPTKNIEMVIGLLSYGAFDLAIRDYEAQFAYRVLLAMPLADQYRFRHIEGGKYFLRLFSNLPKAITKGKGYHEIEVHKTSKEELKKIAAGLKPEQKGLIDEDEGLYDAGKLYAEKRASAGAAIDKLMQQSKTAHDGGWKQADAEQLFKDLAAVGGAGFTGKDDDKDKHFNAKDQLLTETVVHDLDSAGYIEELLKALSNGFLFSEDYRLSTVKIMLARDPVRAAAHARDLVSYGLLDWMVNDREAYLAYLCVKALPEDERAALIKNDAWAWKRIQSEMSREMRQSPDLNIYVGDKEGTDRASVLGQLALDSAWTEENAASLDGLLRMAIAMSEHRFAFERSREFKAYAGGKLLLTLVKKYKLAENAKQEWKADILKGTKWYEEGIFDTLRTIWKGLVFLWDNDLLLVKRSVGGINLDLNQAQDVMGGNLLGAHVGDPSEARDEHGQRNPEANKLTLLADIGAHAVTVLLPDLILDSVNFQSPGGTIEAGSVRLRDLKIFATYDTGDMDQPTAARIDIGGFEINGLLMAMSEKMVTVSRFLASTLHLGAGTKDTTTPSKTAPRGGYYFPFPFLKTIGTAIYYIFKFKGWGTDTPAQEMKHGMEQVRALDLTFASLEVQGLTTSGGQTVGNLKVADFALHIGMNKTTVLRAQIASLGKQIKRKKAQHDDAGSKLLEDRQTQANIDLKKLQADEDWLIRAQQRILHDKLSPDESKQLQDTIDKLKFEAQGAQFLDIGSIDATGISGGVTVKSPIHLEGLHGEGTTQDMAGGLGLGIVTDATLIQQMAEGSKGAPTPFSDRANEFRLAIDKFSAEGVSVGGGQIRSADEIQTKMKEIFKDKDKPAFAGMYAELTSLLPEAQLYEEFIQIGVSALDGPQLTEFRRLRTLLARDPSIVFGSIDLVRAHLDVYGATGGIAIGADEATLKNISMPEKGLSIDEVKGTDIKANAAVGNGLAGWLDWKKNLTGGGVHAGLLEISGARNRGKGLLFEKATLKNGNANVWGRGNVATAGFSSLSVEGLGLEPRLNLMQRRLAALEQSRKPAPAERKERDRLRQDVPALQGLLDEHILAVAAVDKAKSAEERKRPAELLANLDGIIAAMLARYGTAHAELNDFGIKATGAGDVLSDVLDGGFNMDKTLKRGGVTLEGTGDGHQLLGHAGLSYKSPGPDDTRVGKTDASIDAVKLNATIKEDDKNNITVAVTQLELGSIALSEMMLTGLDKVEGGSKIWSSGRSTFNGISFAGDLVFVPVGNPEGDYRLAHIGINRFGIESIEARGFGYANSAMKVDVRASTASVHGIEADGMTIDLPAEKDADAVIIGQAKIQSISNAELAATLPGGMELTHGVLNASAMSVDFLKGGGKKLSTADLSLMAAELRGPDGWARFSLEHLSGAITMDKSGYKLENVKLQKLLVPSLDWKAGATGRVTADQPVELTGLSVNGRIDMKEVDAPAKKGETSKPKKDSQLVGVHIDSFGIDAITAKHLTYKEGDTVIDIGPPTAADKDIPKFMQTFRPFYIEHFTMQGLDWTKDAGLAKGEIDVEKYGAAVVYQDLGKHLKAGGALTGTGMHASFTGPNTGTATLGKIDKVGGFFKNKDISTRFAAMNIMESFTFGDGFVKMNNLSVENVHLGHTSYGEGTDRWMRLKDAYIDKVTVDKVHIDYEKTPDDPESTTKLKGAHIGEVKFDSIRAYDLAYDGKTTETVDDKPVEKTQHLEGKHAWIDSLRFVDIDYNAEEAVTKFGLHVSEKPGKTEYAGRKPEAFGISGITGQLVSKFSDNTSTVADLAASLSGGPIDAKEIKLQTVKLGVEEGTGKDITRTAVTGSFTLSRLGLQSISATYKGRDGVITTVSGFEHSGASLELTNIAPEFNANGTMIIPDMSAQAANFTIKRGDLTAIIPLLDIKNFAVGMSGMGTAEGIGKFRASIGSLSVSQAMSIMLAVHKKQTTQEDVDKAAKAPAGDKLFADPIGGMNGNVVLHTGYGPETIPIRDGKIDFDNATPYIIGIDHQGIYVSRLHYHVLEKDLPGVHADEGNRGKLYLQETVQGLASQAPTVDKEAPKDKPIDLELESGGITLGKGKMGMSPSGKADKDSFYIELPDPNGGENTIYIPNHTIGEQIELNIPKFHATGGQFPGGSVGDIALNLGIRVHNLANVDFMIAADVREGTIKNLNFGDATLALDPNVIKQLPPPSAKDVNPKAVGGKK